MFVELAVASESSHLITHNTRDFVSGSELKHDSFRVVTPYQFLVEWRKSDGK
jgi:predicted nucleic acid-binding protein